MNYEATCYIRLYLPVDPGTTTDEVEEIFYEKLNKAGIEYLTPVAEIEIREV